MNGETVDTLTISNATSSRIITTGTIHQALCSRAKVQSSRSRRARFLIERMEKDASSNHWPQSTQSSDTEYTEQFPSNSARCPLCRSSGSSVTKIEVFLANQ